MEYSRITGNIEVFFDDLNEEAQKVFLEAQGIETPEEGNYDTMPIAVIPIPEEEES